MDRIQCREHDGRGNRCTFFEGHDGECTWNRHEVVKSGDQFVGVLKPDTTHDIGPSVARLPNEPPIVDGGASTAPRPVLDEKMTAFVEHIAAKPSNMREEQAIAALWDALKRASTFDAYQRQAISTAIYPGHSSFDGTSLRGIRDALKTDRIGGQGVTARAYVSLKLNGEAGEVAEEIGKSMRDDGGAITDKRREKLKKELGDVLWYVAALATELGFDLSEIAQANLDKLRDRATRGVLQGSGSDR